MQVHPDKAQLVLSLVAEGGYLAPRDLFVCQTFCPHVFVSLAQHAMAWKNTRDRFLSTASEHVGESVSFIYPKKDKFRVLASTTFAKQKLKLTDEDLEPLDFEMVYIRAARDYFPFSHRRDLYERMLLKFGLDFLPDEKNEGIILPRCARLYKTRWEYLMHIFSFLDEMTRFGFLRQNAPTRAFLLNGKNKKKIQAYAQRLREENIYATLQQTFPAISRRERSTVCAKIYDHPHTDTASLLQEHRLYRQHQDALRARQHQVESSPYARELHRLIDPRRLYDVEHQDFVHLEAFARKYQQREADIHASPWREMLQTYVCPSYRIAQTLDISMEELNARARAYAQRHDDLHSSPWASDIKARFSLSVCMDLSVPLASLEDEVRQLKTRRAQLDARLREKGLAIRQDSTTCRDYIEKRRDDIDQVVAIMEEMHWFFTYTDYADIISSYYASFCDYRDYRYDSESDDEREWKSRGEISQECKARAFRKFWHLRHCSLEDDDHVHPLWSQKTKQNYLKSRNAMRQKIHTAQNAPLLPRICQMYGDGTEKECA